MFGLDHGLLKRLSTVVAFAIAVTTIVVRVALYDQKVDNTIEENKRLRDELENLRQDLTYLQSQSQSKSSMDKYQNRRIDKIETAIFVPRGAAY